LGFIVIALLTENFNDILEVEFTARMEEELDQVEEGAREWKKVIRDFYQPFSTDLEKAMTMIEKIQIKDEEAGKDCSVCSRPMLIKHGRFGKFMACSGFPDCRHTESINEDVGVNCPFCEGSIVALRSKKGRRFYGCSNYPECKMRSWNKPTGEKCPKCGDAMVEKISKTKDDEVICQNPDCKYKPEMRA
ncbi:MAG: topoisomerase DNA-binding C4 zinc finger domain-containing protein, partial [Syntrophomonadaceae bacterium]|nr:topoisomerase DNA-binding C4 zinc finger domain-containing protein [Syntrophomonadaceae bacterium]